MHAQTSPPRGLLRAALTLPADLAQRKLPAQSQAVDGAAIAAKTRLPSAPAGGSATFPSTAAT